MLAVYNILLVLASPVILALLLAKKRCRPGLRQRFGWLPKNVADEWGDGRTIWVHAVSMGEATATVPLVQQLRARYPQCRIIVSTVTETGKETVLRRLDGQAQHLYFPLDFRWAVRAVLDAVRPRLIIIVETELWPNFLREAAARNVPVILVNGRLSTESFSGYLRLRPFFRRVLAAFTLCSMQTDRDVERMVQLGVESERVVRTGNLKYDQAASLTQAAPGRISKRDLGLADGEELFVAGSTHPGEEEAVLDCYHRLLAIAPALVLVLAPRHIERADAVRAVARSRGFGAVRRTHLATPADTAMSQSAGPRVIILDTRGELASLYREATLVFVGGSLVDVGGHSPLEPAAWGKTVVFGPHMDHFAEAAEQFIRQGAATQVRNVDEMADAMTALLKDRSKLEERGKAAYQLVLENQGAVARTVALIVRILEARSAISGQQSAQGPKAER
jgi:3-deoxy-D-manno-octulosonic-acid transferase